MMGGMVSGREISGPMEDNGVGSADRGRVQRERER